MSPEPASAPSPFTERAVELFVQHVARTAGKPEDEEARQFAELCRRHADQAAELERLRGVWAQAAEIHDRLSESGSLLERLKARYGTEVDPGVALDPEAARMSGQERSTVSLRVPAPGAPGAQSPDAPADGTRGEGVASVVRRLGERAPGSGRYRFEGELGRGGMGVVYRIWDEDLRRHLAMKVVRAHGEPGPDPTSPRSRSRPTLPTIDPQTLVRFLEEAQITGQLSHPGIVPVHELGLDAAGHVYFTMRMVRGNSFREVIDWVARGEKGWTRTRALSVLVDVCDALAYAHSKGVIHRDLKPANVMVGRFGETYVMDWGLARVLGKQDRRDLRLRPDASMPASSIHVERERLAEEGVDSPLVTMDGAVVGTPVYMPPEQADGRVEAIDRRSDVYSVGAMLYHLLTGQMPYVAPGDRASPRTILAMVKLAPPRRVHELDPEVPPELEAICEKAMARDPAARYADMRELAEDLRAYLERRVVRAYETGALAEFRKWVARNRGTAAAIAAALLVMLSGAVWIAVVKARANREISARNAALLDANRKLDVAAAEARDEKRAADAARDRAEKNFEEVRRLSDVKRLRDLAARAEALWPAWPAQADGMSQWLAQARELHGRLALHRKALDELRRRATPRAAAAAPAGGGGPAQAWSFADDETQWWHDTLAALAQELEQLGAADPFGVTLVAMERRLERAQAIERQSIDRHLDEWSEAIDRIAASPKYDGLVIREQMGLVPIGEDPESGLFEFWQVDTGERPARDPQSGRVQLDGASGIVLVLLPGGRFQMGGRRPTAEMPAGSANVDPGVQRDEGPVHPVTLAPFFLSKFELTQAQWQRQTGRNPSWFQLEGGNGFEHSPTCPVEEVSWEECARVLAQLGLVPPTEAQWEYAARGGTTTVWWTGDLAGAVQQAANLADRALVISDGAGFFGEMWNDGWAYVAPAGTFAANPFGLHDVIGNVWEWCLDEYQEHAYRLEPRAGDGLVLRAPGPGPALRAKRGGSWTVTAALARSAMRYDAAPEYRSNDLGVRPARPLLVE